MTITNEQNKSKLGSKKKRILANHIKHNDQPQTK